MESDIRVWLRSKAYNWHACEIEKDHGFFGVVVNEISEIGS